MLPPLLAAHEVGQRVRAHPLRALPRLGRGVEPAAHLSSHLGRQPVDEHLRSLVHAPPVGRGIGRRLEPLVGQQHLPSASLEPTDDERRLGRLLERAGLALSLQRVRGDHERPARLRPPRQRQVGLPDGSDGAHARDVVELAWHVVVVRLARAAQRHLHQRRPDDLVDHRHGDDGGVEVGSPRKVRCCLLGETERDARLREEAHPVAAAEVVGLLRGAATQVGRDDDHREARDEDKQARGQVASENGDIHRDARVEEEE